MASVLIIDDEPNIRRMVGALLAAEGFEVREAADGATGLVRAAESEPDAVLLDLSMPGELDGLATLGRLREALPDTPVVMMSGKAGLGDAVKATKLGAFNFLEKPLSPEGVLLALSSAIELRRARHEARALRAEVGLGGEMVGASAAMEKVREMIARVAATDARVLITGETGTGKELVARGDPRRRPAARAGRSCAVNCAAIPRDLVESELFGHEKGAFTGARERRIGRFELADGGTLFLDEIGELAPAAQAKLLRAIAGKEIERVGGAQPIRVDVRVRRGHQQGPGARRRRRDASARICYFRLNVVPHPPCRRCASGPSDIPPLVEHFLAAASRARPACGAALDATTRIALLTRYVAGQRARAGERGRAIGHPVSGPRGDGGRRALGRGHRRRGRRGGAALVPDPAKLSQPLSDTLDEYERALIARALSMAGGNVAEAARRLQTDRPNLYRRMRRLGIDNDGA